MLLAGQSLNESPTVGVRPTRTVGRMDTKSLAKLKMLPEACSPT